MTLRRKVIDFIRLDFLYDPDQIGRIRKVPVMHEEVHALLMRVTVEMVHPSGVKGGRPSLDPMHLIPLLQEELSQIGAVLTGMPVMRAFFTISPSFSFCHRCHLSLPIPDDCLSIFHKNPSVQSRAEQ